MTSNSNPNPFCFSNVKIGELANYVKSKRNEALDLKAEKTTKKQPTLPPWTMPPGIFKGILRQPIVENDKNGKFLTLESINQCIIFVLCVKTLSALFV